ncbi:MAG: alpha/beta hydrolase [Bacteroidota bacterium]
MQHTKKIVEAGVPLREAKKAMILLHGRGGSAEDILTLRSHLPVADFYLVAPQATNHTWYPYSFMAPLAQNEPWLSSAVQLVKSIIDDVQRAGLRSEQIYLLGFSQGACLALEVATRFAQPWGGVIALTGGLIGDRIYPEHYNGHFKGAPILMTNSPNDPHVPLARSEESKRLLEKGGARVSLDIYPNRPHTILADELKKASLLLTP